jgi:hypothetical protein
MTPKERMLEPLIALIHAELGEDLGGREDSAGENLESRLSVRRAARRRRRTAWAGSFAAAASLAAVAVLLLLRAPALTYSVLNGAADSGRVVGKSGTKIQFSDGSEVALEPGAEAKVEELDVHGARVKLKQGEVHVAIVKAPQNAWFVEAGPYTVRVTGTAFDVSWSEKDQLLQVELLRGSVVVTGPLVGTGFTLRPGQRMIGRAAGHVVVEGPRSAAVSPSVTPGASDDPKNLLGGDVQPVVPEASASPVSADSLRNEPPAQRSAWGSLVAQGKFRAVLEEAERRGVEQVLASASLAELAALADAARYARNTSLARRVLLAERQRFPRSRSAKDAAFLLGRLAEESGEGAVGWYDRYLADSPDGPYVSQALGRKMMLWYRQRGVAAAIPLASEYLERYPNGSYASAARKIASRLNQP